MRLGHFLFVLWMILAGVRVSQAQDSANGDDLEHVQKPVDVRSLLESGRDSGDLPEGVVLRVSANLWKTVPADEKLRRAEEAQSGDAETSLEERWEFTAGQVHKVTMVVDEEGDADVEYRRTASRRFDTSELCHQLLTGRLVDIGAGEGKGESMQFVGTEFDVGHRYIELFVDGKIACWAGESCLGPGLPESDARALAALYERLAKPARETFKK